MAKKIIKIEGMTCPHCSRHVAEALKKVSGIKSAKADHQKGEAVIKGEADEAKIKGAIDEAGYTYKGMSDA